MSDQTHFFYVPAGRVDELREVSAPRFNATKAQNDIQQFLDTLEPSTVRYSGPTDYLASVAGYLYDEDILRTTDPEITENLGIQHDDLFELYRPNAKVAGHEPDIAALVAEFHGANEGETIDDPKAAAGIQDAFRAVREAVAATPDGSLLLVRL